MELHMQTKSLSLTFVAVISLCASACSMGTDEPQEPEATASIPLQAKDHKGPPAVAFSACAGKASGDACNFRFGKQVSGTCFAPPEGAPIAGLRCRPEKLPKAKR
jgi:hypothetical protein